MRQQFLGAGLIGLLLRPPQARDQTAEEVLAPLVRSAQQHVLHDGHLGQRLGQLEGAHHSHPGDLVGGNAGHLAFLERPLTLVGAVEPGEQIEEGRLAGTVRADQRRNGTALDLHVLDVDGGQSTELPGHAIGDQDGVWLGGSGVMGDAGQCCAGDLTFLVI